MEETPISSSSSPSQTPSLPMEGDDRLFFSPISSSANTSLFLHFCAFFFNIPVESLEQREEENLGLLEGSEEEEQVDIEGQNQGVARRWGMRTKFGCLVLFLFFSHSGFFF